MSCFYAKHATSLRQVWSSLIKRTCVSLLSLIPCVAFAFSPFVVRDIQVDGIQRTEPGTIFSYIPVKVGERFTEEMATEATENVEVAAEEAVEALDSTAAVATDAVEAAGTEAAAKVEEVAK